MSPDATADAFITGPHRVDQPHHGLVDAVADLLGTVTVAGGATGFAPSDPVETIREVAGRIVDEVRPRRRHLLTLGRGHELVGLAVLAPGQLPLQRHRAELEWLAVHPDLQGQGWGSKLLDAAIAQAQALGLERLFCFTRSGVESFYTARGWTESGRWPNSIRLSETERRDAIWLTRDIDV